MPGFLGGSSGGGGGTGGEIFFPKEFIDPVTKFRVSQPENLIDTDFEYGLQPTKWETVELINNTPSFFSKSGDTTIDGIISMVTNAGTREIIVKTSLAHNLAVGIPINVTGSKSLTADGAFIIASIPDETTFTYLCKSNQNETVSINDLYTSIITGEFFQGSQIGIDDSEGILTDGGSISTLTVKTRSTHGFGDKTPLYFLNLNSTISQDFQAANTATRSFDASNSATAQSFDGSNSLSTVAVDLTNSGVESSIVSTVSSVSTTENTITVTHGSENFTGFTLGTPLYYDVATGAGYFNANPRGVVFLKSTSGLGTSSSTFTVSALPDGDVISIEAALSGTFQPSDLSRTFAGNNVNPDTQTEIQVIVGQEFTFDGGNQGFDGEPNPETGDPDNTGTIVGYTGDSITVTGAENLDYYVGAMVFYNSTGSAAANLTNNTTYFVTSFTSLGPTLYTLTLTDFPGNSNITNISGGIGTQTLSKIGISLDKDIVHVKDSNFARGDMLEYAPPESGAEFSADFEKKFYYVETAYDEHNYKLDGELFRPIVATGGNAVTEIFDKGRYWRVHQFLSTGTQNLEIQKIGTESQVEYLIVGGGGGGGSDMGGGGGAGGFREGIHIVSASGTYPVVVGAGGASDGVGYRGSNPGGNSGQNSSVFDIVAIGGGGGAGGHRSDNQPAESAKVGGSGGGASGRNGNWANGTSGQGNRGGTTGGSWYAGGGGGAGAAGSNGRGGTSAAGGAWGGDGKPSGILGTVYWFSGGGGASGYSAGPGPGGRGGGGGGGRWSAGVNGVGGADGLNPGQTATGSGRSGDGGSGGANTGGGAGGHAHQAQNSSRSGGSGIVVVRYPITAPSNEIISATGGNLGTMEENGVIYATHTFTVVGDDTFTVLQAAEGDNNEIEYLVVGGGGGGGGGIGGGGGAGGLLTGILQNVTVGNYNIRVGAGGRGANGGDSNARGNLNGENSFFGSLTAIGGGRGAVRSTQSASSGGSGGGGSTERRGGGAGTQGQGNNGGGGGSDSGKYPGGGGGGAGGPGGNASGNSVTGNGGPGQYIAWADALGLGEGGYFAGGGGGTDHNRPSGNEGFGGIGGGGSTNFGPTDAQSGSPNTGGGGGAQSYWSAYRRGGDGGSGIVVVRYPIGVVE